MARKHLLTAEMLEWVEEYAPHTIHEKDLFEALGVGSTTWYRWLQEAELTKEEAKDLGITNIKRKRELREILKKAKAKGRLMRLKRIEEAGAGVEVVEVTETEEHGAKGHTSKTVTKTKVVRNWAADAWWLERNFPEMYAVGRDIERGDDDDSKDEMIFTDEVGEDEDDGMNGQLDDG